MKRRIQNIVIPIKMVLTCIMCLLCGIGLAEGLPSVEGEKIKVPAQVLDISVSGRVTDSKGEGLPGVSVVVKDASSGTITDVDGNYRLQVPDNAALIFSYVGFITREVKVNYRSVIDVALEENLQELDEVVVIGYGTQQKKDLTGAVSSLSEEDFNVGSISSVEQLVQGRTTGIQISTQSAEPGGNFVIRVRGNNSIQNDNQPIYVVDGFPMDNLDNSINPSNIKSIEVLKDASAAAIYGTRGANGVIIITTKQGKSGAVNIDYNAEYGQQVVSNLDTYEFLGTRAFTENDNLIQRVNGAMEMYSPSRIDSLEQYFGSTNWLQEAFRDGATVNHQLGISSGKENSRVYFSAGYFNQQGVVPSTEFSRYNTRINLNQRMFDDKLTFGLNTGITYTNTNFLGFNASNLQTNILRNIFADARPFVPNRLDNLTETEIQLLGGTRPISPLQTIEASDNEAKSTYILSTGFVELEVLEGLKVKALGGSRMFNGKEYGYLSQESHIVAGTLQPGEAALTNNQSYDLLFEGTINYQKRLGKHGLNLLAGYTNQKVIYESFRAGARDFTTNTLGWNALQAGAIPTTPSSGTSERKLISYLSRAIYDYDDRYLLTLTFRRDGSSKFGANNKWANFPAAAIGWKVHNEAFMSGQSLLSNLKLRASYGITGSERFRVGLAQTQFQANAPVTLDGDNQSIGTVPSVLGNGNLQWEETTQMDLGTDIGLFKDRIVLEFDYYVKNTDKLIVTKSLPPSLGFGSIITNVGRIQNSGVEILLSSNNVTSKNFSWVTDINVSFNSNEIKEVLLPDGSEFLEGAELKPIGQLDRAPYTIIQKGIPVNSFYGYKVRGVLQEGETDVLQPSAVPGDALYHDIDGDSAITSADRTILGHGFPKYLAGLTNTITYKSFRLSFFFNGVFDADVLNINREIGYRTNRLESALERWTPETPEGTRPFRNHSGQFWVNDELVEDASFIRLKNISLSYDLPVDKMGLKFVQNLRLYASASNLYTWTNYSGFDPEVSARVNSTTNLNIGSGVDLYSYPLQKSYAVGVKVKF